MVILHLQVKIYTYFFQKIAFLWYEFKKSRLFSLMIEYSLAGYEVRYSQINLDSERDLGSQEKLKKSSSQVTHVFYLLLSYK